MSTSKIGDWGDNAYQIVKLLVEVIGPRGSTTSREEEAAAYIQHELEKKDIPFENQSFVSPKSAWQPFLLIFLMAASTVIVAPLAVPYSAGFASLFLLFLVWIGLREINLQNSILLWALAKGDSQNVIGRIPPKGDPRQTIVLVAHLDSHRTPYFHQTRERQALLDRLVKIAVAGLFTNALIFLLASLLQRAGLIWLAIPFTLIFILVAVICWQADRTPFSPGANDNAAAVGVVMTMASELAAHPLTQTDVWLLFSGCEEVGCYGMRHFLDTYGPALNQAKFINFEMVGHGLPGIVLQEGLLFKQKYDPTLITEATQAAITIWGNEPLYKNAAAYGESVVTQAAGHPSITLNTLLADTLKTAYWHRPDDTLNVIEEKTLGQIVSWGLELLARMDDA